MFKKFKRFVSVMCLSLGVFLSQPSHAVNHSDFDGIGRNSTTFHPPSSSSTSTDLSTSTYVWGTVTALGVQVFNNYWPFAWSAIKKGAGSIGTALLSTVSEHRNLHHFLRRASSKEMNIRDLFKGQQPDQESRILLETLSQAMQDAGWKQYPIVYRDEKASLSDDGLLVGYQYTLEKGGMDQVSLMIVRNVPKRGIEKAITKDQKSSFYPLHPNLKGQAVDLIEIERMIPKRIAASPDDTYSFGKASDSSSNSKASSSSSTSKPSNSSSDNEALERFYQSFPRSFIQPNVSSWLKTTFNQYSVTNKTTEFQLNTAGTLGTLKLDVVPLDLLKLDATLEKTFDIYFIKHRERF